MSHIITNGGSRRRRYELPIALSALVLFVASCGGGSDADGVAWSADPCGLAPPQDIAAAFGLDPQPIADTPPGECRYELGDTLLRIIVLSDTNSCDAARRAYEAVGTTLDEAEDAPAGVFVTDPEGDVVVCDRGVTFVLDAEGRTTQLLPLVTTLPSQRSD